MVRGIEMKRSEMLKIIKEQMVTVHRYKYSQDTRRRLLRRLSKIGILKFSGLTKTHFKYEVLNQEEYNKRVKQ